MEACAVTKYSSLMDEPSTVHKSDELPPFYRSTVQKDWLNWQEQQEKNNQIKNKKEIANSHESNLYTSANDGQPTANTATVYQETNRRGS